LGWSLALVGLAMVVLTAGIIWFVVDMNRGPLDETWPTGEDTSTADSSPTVTPWDEKPSQLYCPTSSRTGNTPQEYGKLNAGTLQVDTIDGWEYQAGPYLFYAFDYHSQFKTALGTDSDVSVASAIWVALLAKDDGFSDLADAASLVMACDIASIVAETVTGQSILLNQAIVVDGHSAWELRYELGIYTPDLPQWKGRLGTVIVVNLGDDKDHLGLYWSTTVTGAGSHSALIDSNIETLRVIA